MGTPDEAVIAPSIPGHLTLSPVTADMREQYGLDDDIAGLVVVGVEADSDAETKGLREGDLITEVGQEAVNSAADMRDRIEAAEEAGRSSVLLLVIRDEAPRFVALNVSG